MPDISPKDPLDLGDGRWALAMIDELRKRGAVAVEVGGESVKATFAAPAPLTLESLPSEPVEAAAAYRARYPHDDNGIALLEAALRAANPGAQGGTE